MSLEVQSYSLGGGPCLPVLLHLMEGGGGGRMLGLLVGREAALGKGLVVLSGSKLMGTGGGPFVPGGGGPLPWGMDDGSLIKGSGRSRGR